MQGRLCAAGSRASCCAECSVFFFQAEDGIRDLTVTGVQTCALPISDVVHHIGYTNDAPLFWRQAREQTFLFKALVHAGATGYGSPDFGRALGGDANGVFALLEPGPGFRLEALRPDGQKLEGEFREAVQKRTGSYPLGGHQLAGGGLWLLKVVLDRAKSDDLDKFRDAVMSLDLPIGSVINGWGVKFGEDGQDPHARGQP